MFLYRGNFRGSTAFDITLVALFFILVYIFFSRRSYLSQVTELTSNKNEKVSASHKGFDMKTSDQNLPQRKSSNSRKTANKGKTEQDEERIQEKVNRIPDARTPACKNQPNKGATVPATLIIDFFDYTFYDMKLTLESVKKFTAPSLIKEIIIVDDGTTLEYILSDVKLYMKKLSNAVLLRNEERMGQAAARIQAAKAAKGVNLIFLDPTVVVSKGWIEPLLAFIQKEPNVIAVPHHDKINDPVTYEFIKTDISTVSSLTWSLEVITTQTKVKDKNANDPIPSAAIRGNVFAVTKDYLTAIGGLDAGFSDGGGDALELSIRTWLCSGRIEVLPCSRVGVMNLYDSVKINSNKNKWRLIQLWMKDFQKIIHLNLGNNPSNLITKSDRESLDKRRKELKKLSCKSISWYVDNVAKDIYIPPSDAKHNGLLKIQNGHCAHVGDDSRIDLSSCSPDHHNLLKRDMIFTLTTGGQLKWGIMCLSVQESAYILPETCDSNNDHQLWTYEENKQLVNKWSGFCMSHVTDPDPKLADQRRQIAMAQKCDNDNSEQKEFSSWQFVKP